MHGSQGLLRLLEYNISLPGFNKIPHEILDNGLIPYIKTAILPQASDNESQAKIASVVAHLILAQKYQGRSILPRVSPRASSLEEIEEIISKNSGLSSLILEEVNQWKFGHIRSLGRSFTILSHFKYVFICIAAVWYAVDPWHIPKVKTGAIKNIFAV